MSEAQHIIERYTQPAVSRIMTQGLNPLDVPLRKVERVSCCSPTWSLLGDQRSAPDRGRCPSSWRRTSRPARPASPSHGGEVTKFLGDGVMAYFDATEADDASRAASTSNSELERIRAEAPARSALRLLYSGFGLALGPVIEGSIGSSVKMDYTIIGEPVNTAARLEGLTRTLDTPVLMTGDVCAAAQGSWTFADAGVFDLGGDTPTTVRSLGTPATAPLDMRATVARHLAEHPASGA